MSEITPLRPARFLKIGQLAKLTGISARNLRFYADTGVFGELPRSPKGYRLFPPEAIHWVRMLRISQAAGFSLEEVQHLLHALQEDKVPCQHVRQALGEKLASLESRLREIKMLVEILQVTLNTPDGASSDLGCNLMEILLAQAEQLPALARA